MKKALIICGAVIIMAAIGFLGYQLMDTRNELSSTKNVLNAKTNEMSELNIRLDNTKEALKQMDEDFSKTNNELFKTESELRDTQKEYDYMRIERNQALTDLGSSKVEVGSLITQIESLNNRLDNLNSQVSSLAKDISLYKDTFGEVFEGINPQINIYDTEPPSEYFTVLGPTPIRQLKLIENNNAQNPSYPELLQFLQRDQTDSFRYMLGYYVCSNFAEKLHNNAETAGIRTAFVTIKFDEGPGHAINAFLTTDKGLLYIDCTGSDTRLKPASMDSYALNLKLGDPYIRKFLFQSSMQFETNENKVTDVEIYW